MKHAYRSPAAQAAAKGLPFAASACDRAIDLNSLTTERGQVECPDCLAVLSPSKPLAVEVESTRERPRSPLPALRPLGSAPAGVEKRSFPPLGAPRPASVTPVPPVPPVPDGGFSLDLLLPLFGRLQALEAGPDPEEGWERWAVDAPLTEDDDRAVVSTGDRHLLREVFGILTTLQCPRVGQRLLAIVDGLSVLVGAEEDDLEDEVEPVVVESTPALEPVAPPVALPVAALPQGRSKKVRPSA